MPELPLHYSRPVFDSKEDERQWIKVRLAAAFRLFNDLGYGIGVAGHITARDPIEADCFWVNPAGQSFHSLRAEDLLKVDSAGNVVKGSYAVNDAAFAIHSAIHQARPDVNAVAHAHSEYGRTWAALGRELDPISQDSCLFFQNHAVCDEFSGVVLEAKQAQEIVTALEGYQAVILKNHGLLSVGSGIDQAIWTFICLENSCKSQLLAEAVGSPHVIDDESARLAKSQVGSDDALWHMAQPLFDQVLDRYPDLTEN